MQMTIRNNAQLSKKHIRFIKWKFNNIKEKFQRLIYMEIFLNSEGQSPKKYEATIRLGVTGHDIIINSKSENLEELFQKSYQSVHRYLAKRKALKTKRKSRSSKQDVLLSRAS